MKDDPTPKRKGDGSPTSGLDSLQEAGRYLHLGFEFLGAILLFVGAGYLLDRWLGTVPLFTLIGVALAFVGIMMQVLIFSRKETAQAQRKRRESSSSDSDT